MSDIPASIPISAPISHAAQHRDTGRFVLPRHERRLPTVRQPAAGRTAVGETAAGRTAANALRALAGTAAPAQPAVGSPQSPLVEALHGLGRLSPTPSAPSTPPAHSRTASGPSEGAHGESRTAPLRLAGLSPAESRVAALAAAGYCNREIARRLFITVSTVEQHLTKAYRKLGVASRADLPSPAWRGEEPSEPPASYGRGRPARGNEGRSR
jgi:DNA-binding CsgD family transcriptional regulator